MEKKRPPLPFRQKKEGSKPNKPVINPKRPASFKSSSQESQKEGPRSSWENVGQWYSHLVGKEGHFFHQEVIFPKLTRYLDFNHFAHPSLLDVGCGAGTLLSIVPPQIPYVGVDASPSLIQQGQKLFQKDKNVRQFVCTDATKPYDLGRQFTHSCMILSVQNMQEPQKAFHNIGRHLQKDGRLMIVMNHPCFRIPRQTHWEVDQESKIQYRRVNKYLSPMSIPISMSPSQGKDSAQTWSYHFPLSDYTKWLYQEGFHLLFLEEWVNPKESLGKMAKAENRAREEIPMFLFLLAQKI